MKRPNLLKSNRIEGINVIKSGKSKVVQSVLTWNQTIHFIKWAETNEGPSSPAILHQHTPYNNGHQFMSKKRIQKYKWYNALCHNFKLQTNSFNSTNILQSQTNSVYSIYTVHYQNGSGEEIKKYKTKQNRSTDPHSI